jgi:Carboxypeptidase regulatory-like domain
MKTRHAIRIAVAVLALSVAGLASAQSITGQVVGRVIDAGSGKPVVGATVTASSPSWIEQSVRTDATGHYVIALLPPARYQVAVQAPGYVEALPRDVQVLIDWRIRNDFRLLPASARGATPGLRVAQNR